MKSLPRGLSPSEASFAPALVIGPIRQGSKRQSWWSMARLTSETPIHPPCPTSPKPHGARQTVSSPHGLCPAAPLAAMRRAYSTPGVSPPIVWRHLLSTDTCTHAAAGSPCGRASTGFRLSRSLPLKLDAGQASGVSSCSSPDWHEAHDETSAFGKPLNPQLSSKA